MGVDRSDVLLGPEADGQVSAGVFGLPTFAFGNLEVVTLNAVSSCLETPKSNQKWGRGLTRGLMIPPATRAHHTNTGWNASLAE